MKRDLFESFGHDSGHEESLDEIIETIERRILVNITVGMDKGLGSAQHEVYHLQVAVPLKAQQKAEDKEFYAYHVDESEERPEQTTGNEQEGSGNDIEGGTESASGATEVDESSTMEQDGACECSSRNNTRGLELNVNGNLNTNCVQELTNRCCGLN